MNVATNPEFKGQLKDIEKQFLTHLREFVPLILSPANIVTKRISGNEIKAKELVQFFKAYMEIFKVKY